MLSRNRVMERLDRELLDIISENLMDLTSFVVQVGEYLRRVDGS